MKKKSKAKKVKKKLPRPTITMLPSLEFFPTVRFLESKRPGIEQRLYEHLQSSNCSFTAFDKPDLDTEENEELLADWNVITEEFGILQSTIIFYVSW